jgi:hypothetical protein
MSVTVSIGPSLVTAPNNRDSSASVRMSFLDGDWLATNPWQQLSSGQSYVTTDG